MQACVILRVRLQTTSKPAAVDRFAAAQVCTQTAICNLALPEDRQLKSQPKRLNWKYQDAFVARQTG